MVAGLRRGGPGIRNLGGINSFRAVGEMLGLARDLFDLVRGLQAVLVGVLLG